MAIPCFRMHKAVTRASAEHKPNDGGRQAKLLLSRSDESDNCRRRYDGALGNADDIMRGEGMKKEEGGGWWVKVVVVVKVYDQEISVRTFELGQLIPSRRLHP